MAEWKLATTDDEIDAALTKAQAAPQEPRIVEAIYRSEPSLDILMLRLSDSRRLVLPREDLQILASATPDQAADFKVGPNGVSLWWSQLDEGLYLPNLLEHRYGNERWMESLQRRGVAA